MKVPRLDIAMAAAVLAALLSACAAMGGATTADGWITILDGKTLEGWDRVGNANWRIADGAAVADKGIGYLVSKREYADFQLRAEFWADSAANSGILVRCVERENMTPETCYEVNIWDERPAPEYGTGAIVDIAKVSPMPRAGGRWNVLDITARGDRLAVELNGVRTVEARHAKLRRGVIGLQYGPGVVKDSGAVVRFRKVEIRPL